MSNNYIHPKSIIGKNTKVEPFSYIDADVEIGNNCWIGNNVTIYSGARIGDNVRIFPGAVISSIPQDLKFGGEKTTVTIGNYSTIRETASGSTLNTVFFTEFSFLNGPLEHPVDRAIYIYNERIVTTCTGAIPEVVPFQGKVGTMGTNPWTWALPTAATRIGFDFVFDWATSVMSNGSVKALARAGRRGAEQLVVGIADCARRREHLFLVIHDALRRILGKDDEVHARKTLLGALEQPQDTQDAEHTQHTHHLAQGS